MIKTALLILIALGVTATLLPLLKSGHWAVRLWDFPRLQIMFYLLIVFILSLFIFDMSITVELIFSVSAALTVIYQLVLIYRYTPLAKKQVLSAVKNADGSTVSILISNVYMKNKNYRGFIDNVNNKNPDIILAIETDNRWSKKLDVLDKEYSYSKKIPLENTYGMLLYSKLELINVKVKYLLEKDIPSIHTMVKLRSGDKIELHCLHPKPPAPQESESSSKRDAELLITGKEVREKEWPVIVAGDLNDVAWSHTTRLFQRVSGLLDPRIGRGFFSTYNANVPILRWPLDHIFHSDHFKLIALELLDNFGSDHFPVFIKLLLDPKAKHEQDEPVPDGKEDFEETENKILEGNGLK